MSGTFNCRRTVRIIVADQISTKNDSFDVQEFILILKEHREYFGKTSNEADEFCNILTPLLDNFAQSSTPEDMRMYGKQLITHLSTIAEIIKRLLDGKCEVIH
jgi:hypothetical protein